MATTNFSDRINNIINDALNTMDFGQLNSDINSTVKDALYNDDIKLSHDDNTFDYEKASDNKGENYSHHNYDDNTWGTPFSNLSGANNNVPPTDTKIPVAKKPAGSYSGIIMIVCGILGICIFGAMALVTMAVNTFTPLNAIVPVVVLGCLTVGSAGVIIGGTNIRKRLKKFKEYLSAMDDDEFCEIKKLAAKCRRGEKSAIADLKKMIDLRMFQEGHIDDTNKWFIGNNIMYDKYIAAKDNFENQQKKDTKEAERRAGESDEDRRLRLVLEKGEESIQQIRNANTALPGVEISNQLDKLEGLVIQIFKRIEEKPVLLPDIKKFMDYYLPTTIKLVTVYTDFEKKSVQSDEMKKAKIEIEETLSNIELAFEKLLNELYEDTVMDVSTDISVLKTMFARDGLTEKDF